MVAVFNRAVSPTSHSVSKMPLLILPKLQLLNLWHSLKPWTRIHLKDTVWKCACSYWNRNQISFIVCWWVLWDTDLIEKVITNFGSIYSFVEWFFVAALTALFIRFFHLLSMEHFPLMNETTKTTYLLHRCHLHNKLPPSESPRVLHSNSSKPVLMESVSLQ